MPMLTIRVSDDDLSLFKSYASTLGQTLSGFVRDTVLDRIEDDLEIDEERILKAWEASKNEKGISLDELCKELGI